MSIQKRLSKLEAKEPEPVTFVVIIDPDDDRPGIDIDGPIEPSAPSADVADLASAAQARQQAR